MQDGFIDTGKRGLYRHSRPEHKTTTPPTGVPGPLGVGCDVCEMKINNENWCKPRFFIFAAELAY